MIVDVVLPASGTGQRTGSSTPKQVAPHTHTVLEAHGAPVVGIMTLPHFPPLPLPLHTHTLSLVFGHSSPPPFSIGVIVLAPRRTPRAVLHHQNIVDTALRAACRGRC